MTSRTQINTFLAKTKLIPVVGIFLLVTACQHLFDEEDITQNPNAVNDVDMRTLLSGTMLGVGYLHQDTDVRIAALWTRHINGLARAHQGYSQYIVSSTNFNWNQLYPVAGQARLLQKKAEEAGESRIQGIGQVLEALAIAKATALWGDVPYLQAFQPVAFPTPVYDSQSEVYDQLLLLLDEAIVNLSANTGLSLATNDFFFGGDNTLWTEAAYTLKARLHLHRGQYQAAIDNALQGLSATEHDMLVPHGNSQGVNIYLNHDFFAITRTGDTGFDGAFFPELLQSRISGENTKTNESALYDHFITNGLTGSNSLDPNIVDGAFVADAPHPVLTYYENQLILAESYARTDQLTQSVSALNTLRQGLQSGYINGLTFSDTNRQYDAYDMADFEPSGLANTRNYQEPQLAILYEIIAQRYIVLLMQYESFNDYRRLATALPRVELDIPLSTGTRRPQRFIYPQEQVNTNPNTPSPLPDQYQVIPVFE